MKSITIIEQTKTLILTVDKILSDVQINQLKVTTAEDFPDYRVVVVDDCSYVNVYAREASTNTMCLCN